jgi:WD40 repeat protein
LSPDGRSALTGSADGAAILWNVESGKSVRRFERREGGIWTVAFHPYERWILTGGAETTARLLDVESGRQLRVLEGHGGGIRAVSPTGTLF